MPSFETNELSINSYDTGHMTLIDSLNNAAIYPHPVEQIEVIETHISWLILTGNYAYKIKKPVDFGFLDFTTLAKRQHFCEEELRLNQRLAPDIYQKVIAIGGTPDTPTLNPHEGEEIIEYAVQMRQFNPEQRLDLLLQNQRFEPIWIDMLAEQIATFHSEIPIVAKDSPWGETETIWEVISDNFLHITDSIEQLDDWHKVQKLSHFTAQQFRKLTPLIEKRKAQGHVRECHGDLHLANITLYKDELRLFDCIEFNLQFRWIDTISDLAFLLMDLEANGEFRWANRCLNRYMELSGDYQALPLLNLYKAYRSMVRAKVSVLGDMHDLVTLRRYLRLTEYYSRKPKPVLFLMHGISGSGKSHLSQQLVDQTDTIRIRSDVERKRLFRELSLKGTKLDMYGPQMNAHTFNHLFDTSAELLRNGYSVVVDATFIRQRTRQSYIDLANKLGIPIRIISCECEQKLIEARLKRRVTEGSDASDADIHVMQDQMQHQQPLTEAEQGITVTINTDDDDAISRLLEQLRIEEVIF
ncbi:bifunctional aminoglycoside phosphotransferase/ATP-binding protein [uncultured Neptuniibacter sp.]|uniref:bifunctional aminoglycoside phosphotransferase/ATP-binding protein n=1 Tax=uncultured Neptuniibacter sp. TaxID=502143 RepID=UPI002633156D|nr:bifunctional aminoglycoside phosphotransferase/ATP-binding protein [uncultured Neptuniibacter sp.]